MPATARYAELARLAVTGVAARNGCGHAAVDKLAAEFEPVFATFAGGPSDTVGGDVTITAEIHGDTVVFEVARHPDGGEGRISLQAQR